MKRSLLALLIVTTLLVSPRTAFGYLKMGFQFDARQVSLKWNRFPVRYHVANAGAPGVTAADFQAAVGRAFATWQAVPTAAISYQLGGITAAAPGDGDGLSTLGFADRPDLDRVLATTNLLVDDSTGSIVEADIVLNSSFPWSAAASGEAGRFDVESIVLHEIGHLSGLGHSAIGETELRPEGGRRVIAAEAVMFPVAFSAGSTADRTLRADDIAGISDLYPDEDFATNRGSLSGRVTKSGVGVFGAHVVAFNLRTGAIVANFSLSSRGAFSIAGLSPGVYVVRVEPLDDASIDGFFSASEGVEIDFRVTYFDRLVVVPQGGDSGAIEVRVVRK